ncbi:MAG TPA: hypothetical protein VMQ86_25280 [Bryobacteraceae bacterium]|jgi:hypothetical protein|nr:hypothetical protein [Bryobacteraceae bacterium]
MFGTANRYVLTASFLLALLPGALFCQSAEQPPEQGANRIFGIIPNYRTFPSLKNYKPLTAKQKFKLANQDVSDRGTFVLAAAFAGEGMLTKSNPSFGHGIEGYSHYLGTAFCDLAVGDYMTEAVFPVLLHQDPRYFRRGAGSGWSRLGYAMGQIFWTHKDSGGTQFNFSEIGGNATAVALSNLYYPDGRTAGQNLSRFGVQIADDMAGNILKEFWPDLRRKFSRKTKQQ